MMQVVDIDSSQFSSRTFDRVRCAGLPLISEFRQQETIFTVRRQGCDDAPHSSALLDYLFLDAAETGCVELDLIAKPGCLFCEADLRHQNNCGGGVTAVDHFFQAGYSRLPVFVRLGGTKKKVDDDEVDLLGSFDKVASCFGERNPEIGQYFFDLTESFDVSQALRDIVGEQVANQIIKNSTVFPQRLNEGVITAKILPRPL